MLEFANRIILASGSPRRFVAFAGGAVGALAMAPVDFFPAMFVPMVLAVWLIDGSAYASTGMRWASLRSAFGAGWWLGFGYFVGGLWWLGAAFLVAADRYAWALPIGVLGLPAVLAIFTGCGFVVARLLWSPGPARILALAAGLSLSEYARGHLFTGFPWNDLGMTLGGNLVLAQFASVTGLYGLTILTVAIFAAPATLVDLGARASGRRRVRAAVAAPVMALAVLVALGLYGVVRLGRGSAGVEPGVALRIMQPDLPEDDHFRADNKDAILTRYLTLSDRATSPQTPGMAGVTALISARKSAFPFILSRDPDALARIGAVLPTGTSLVTGAARAETTPADGSNSDPQVHYFNSIEVIASGGKILDSSDKVHLVPFGEYTPFAALFDRMGIQQFIDMPGGFDAGVERKLLSVPGLPPVAPLICYEAIFPGDVLPDNGSDTRPGLLLNVTNDAWFGRTAGPYQHFAQARLRTIEEGLPLVRAGNTGISAIVDPYGRIIRSLPLEVEGVLDGPLPERIAAPFFAKSPLVGMLTLWLIALVVALIFKRRASPGRDPAAE